MKHRNLLKNIELQAISQLKSQKKSLKKILIFLISFFFAVATINAQTTWSPQTAVTSENLNSIYFVNNFKGWAVGDNGTILHTSDGGYSWSTQTSGVSNMLYAVFFANDSVGWAAGLSGKLLHTTNGGQNWAAQTSGTTEKLNTISFINDSTGWIGGNNNAIIFTNNGGTTWSSKASGFYPTTNGIFFTDANNGWLAGNTGYIIRTTNGGTNWTIQHTGGSNLMDIFFISNTTGWAVGLSGTIFKTENGGTSWVSKTSGTTEALQSVFFTDSLNGWLTGLNGLILNTTDGGTTWVDKSLSSVTKSLLCVTFPNSSTGFISGNTGTILKYSSSQEICMVTVDSVLNKNKIIWEKITGLGAASYNIYKLSGSVYQLLGNVPYTDMSEFIDYSSQPNVVASRYKISVVDSFSNESALSPYHQTINLGISQGVPSTTMVLNWNFYEDESAGFIPDWYYIYRGTTASNISLFDSVSSAFNLYNDLNVTQLLYYKITVNKPNACYPTSSNKSVGGPYSQSISNIEESIIVSAEILSTENSKLLIYPNPFSDKTTITIPNFKPQTSNFKLTLTDITGKEIRRITKIESGKVEIEKGYLSKGIYFVELRGVQIYRGKLVVE